MNPAVGRETLVPARDLRGLFRRPSQLTTARPMLTCLDKLETGHSHTSVQAFPRSNINPDQIRGSCP